MKTVGQFRIDEEGTLYGPGEYMREQGNKKLDGMLAGTDPAFNVMLQVRPDADPETMILVALQTDYAGWIGVRQLVASLK